MTHPTTARSSAPPIVRGRRRLGYGLALLVAVVGAAAAALWAVTGFLDQVQRPEQFARTGLPGSTALVVTQTGAHVVYAEGVGTVDLTASDLTVLDPGGLALPVQAYPLDLRYDVPGEPGRVGVAVGVFDADRTGSYRVASQAVVDRAVLAVGDDLAPDVLRSVLLPSVVGALAVLAGIGLALTTWRRDERSNRP